MRVAVRLITTAEDPALVGVAHGIAVVAAAGAPAALLRDQLALVVVAPEKNSGTTAYHRLHRELPTWRAAELRIELIAASMSRPRRYAPPPRHAP
jgi:hypothetical protein